MSDLLNDMLLINVMSVQFSCQGVLKASSRLRWITVETTGTPTDDPIFQKV